MARDKRNGMPRAMPRAVNDPAAQAKMAAETKKRREAALPVTNFLMDGESGLVLMSAGKTQGGVALLAEQTVSMTFMEFAQAAAAFTQTMANVAANVAASSIPMPEAGKDGH